MPVWHERTRDLVKAGALRVVGITQEQHPERCRLFCQWKGIDWPILWDPFNLTGSKVVPNVTLVDEHGVIRERLGGRQDAMEALREFLSTAYEPPEDQPAPPPEGSAPAKTLAPARVGSIDAGALAALLWHRDQDPTKALETLFRPCFVGERDFRLGVAYRMRHDSPFAAPDDFRKALGFWQSASGAEPDQYIWRRRLQQYGPQPDKPYPFYDWVDRARRAVAARGEEPIRLRAALSRSERMDWDVPHEDRTEPDPEGRIPTLAGAARVDAAVAWDTAAKTRTGRLHLEVRLVSPDVATWTPDAGPVVAWIGTPDGEGWRYEPRRLEAPTPPGAPDGRGAVRPVRMETDLHLPAGDGAIGYPTLEGYVLLPVCRRADGACLVIRASFALPLRPPR